MNTAIRTITQNTRAVAAVLRRIPKRISPDLYFKAFRPFIVQAAIMADWTSVIWIVIAFRSTIHMGRVSMQSGKGDAT